MNLARKLALIFFVFSVLIISTNSTYANDTVEVQVDIMGDTVSIDVPDSLYLGEVARGFDTNDTTKITIVNKGNTKVTITPELVDDSSIFSNLYMKRIQSESFKKIGVFSMNISRPSTLGGTSSENCYIKLDLSDYEEDLDAGTNRKSADVRFVAVAA
jgi:hypothetical protein